MKWIIINICFYYGTHNFLIWNSILRGDTDIPLTLVHGDPHCLCVTFQKVLLYYLWEIHFQSKACSGLSQTSDHMTAVTQQSIHCNVPTRRWGGPPWPLSGWWLQKWLHAFVFLCRKQTNKSSTQTQRRLRALFLASLASELTGSSLSPCCSFRSFCLAWCSFSSRDNILSGRGDVLRTVSSRVKQNNTTFKTRDWVLMLTADRCHETEREDVTCGRVQKWRRACVISLISS